MNLIFILMAFAAGFLLVFGANLWIGDVAEKRRKQVKRRLDEGLTARQQMLARGWQSSILRVAREEMAHLGIVSNLLAAVGERLSDAEALVLSAPGIEVLELEAKEKRVEARIAIAADCPTAMTRSRVTMILSLS